MVWSGSRKKYCLAHSSIFRPDDKQEVTFLVIFFFLRNYENNNKGKSITTESRLFYELTPLFSILEKLQVEVIALTWLGISLPRQKTTDWEIALTLECGIKHRNQ